jgi:DNA-binding PadR family transcriptional regulator
VKGKTLKALEDLGLRISDRDITMLKAIVEASGAELRPATYAEISQVHAEMAKREFSKAWMYRCLNSLRDQGLIREDTVQHPKGYFIDRSHMESALRKRQRDRTKELKAARSAVEEKLDLLRGSRMQELAIRAFDAMVGNAEAKTSNVIEGIENVRHTVIREFGEAADNGDTVRVLSFISLLNRGLPRGGLPERKLMSAAERGAKVLGLMVPQSKESLGTDLIAGFTANMSDHFQKTTATGNILLRISREVVNTYRMVSLNRDKMILYLTNAIESDSAALIQRKDNPGLIDDAVDTFDRLFQDGVDVLDVVRGMLQQKSAS